MMTNTNKQVITSSNSTKSQKTTNKIIVHLVAISDYIYIFHTNKIIKKNGYEKYFFRDILMGKLLLLIIIIITKRQIGGLKMNQPEQMQAENQIQPDNREELPNPSEEDIQAFIIAIKSGSINQMQELLHKYKANIVNRLESQLRQPPLYFASIIADEAICQQMIQLLVEHGANINFKDSHEQTIMFYICRDGKNQTAKYLISKGARIHEKDIYGQTPIFYVASQNKLEMLELFPPEQMCHVDQLAHQTPLYYAARKGHLEMCKFLIEKGCDPNHVDTHKKTPIQYAKKARYQQVADYLNAEGKKSRELSRMQSQSVVESQQIESKKRKKENVSLNTNRNTYKITLMRQNGELHDLTEDEVKDLMKTNSELQSYLTNPETIPQELLESTLQENWQKIALKVLNSCWKLKGSYWFQEPVDPIKYGIVDYNDVIRTPMDLGSVKKRLNHNYYSNAKQFVADMRLVWRNCYRYNGQEHEISRYARQVENLFEESIKSQGLTKYLDE